ncbi:hypothetical protein [Kitasatospora mediocidica]|uniref:hypothetical protein n=1 Tax=Kitasatospora mediocidica TaxID=58352 RepID=UPI00056C781D|nr:hypothetical protein [Kitasatospora mediocidica]
MQGLHWWVPAMAAAVVAAALTGCSSSAGTSASAHRPALPSAAGATATPSATAGAGDAAPPGAAPSSAPAPAPARPADACVMLTSDQVAAAVGTPGPYNDSHEDPADDGTPVWGCTWGTRTSYADLREVTTVQYLTSTTAGNVTGTPLSGIGDGAILTVRKDDGSMPTVHFTTGSHFYAVSVTLDRSETDAANAGKETAAEQALATTLAKALTG